MSVEVEVKSQLSKIIEDLEKIQKSAQTLSGQMKTSGEDVGKSIDGQTKKVSSALTAMGAFGRRTADQLKKDFMSLGSIASLTSGIKLGEQFGGSVKEAVNLSDTVRRLGGVFGIAKKDFSSFQSLLQSGLGAIGASSDAAANALKGLAETPVRGQANLLAYARTAAELASISGEKGQEGAIAKGAAGIITSRGGNPNDMKQLDSVSNEILQIRQATGKSVTEITTALGGLYAGTNKSFQGSLKNGGSTTLAAASLLGGPQATSFIENFLGKNKFQRLGQEAQGFKNIMGGNGELNAKAIASILSEAKGRGLGDAQAGLSTMGLSDEEAKGFIRLADALKQNESAIQGAHKSVVDINQTYRDSMSLGDSFRASINKVKGAFAPVLSWATQGITNVMQAASHSTGGAIAATGGAAVLAAVLTGGGLRGVGKGLMGNIGDEAKAKAFEAATGEKVQRVEVINFPNGSGSDGMPGLGKSFLEKSGGLMGTGGIAAGGTAAATGISTAATVAAGVGALGVGVAAGYGLAKGSSKLYDIAAKTEVGQAAGLGELDKKIQSVFDAMWMKLSGFDPVHRVHVDVSSKTRDLRATKLPGRSQQ